MEGQRYIVENRQEVFVVRTTNALDRPSAQECAALDRYFTGPDARDEHGEFWDLCGLEIEGIDGDVVWFPYRIG